MASSSLSELRGMIDGVDHPVEQLIDAANLPLDRACSSEQILETTIEVSSSSPSTTEESDSVDCSSIQGLLTERGASNYTKTPRQRQQEEIVTNLRERRKSMEKLDIFSPTPNKIRLLKHKKGAKEMNTPLKGQSRAFGKPSNLPRARPKEVDAEENFLDLLSRSQSRRINEQRCSGALLKNRGHLHGNPIVSSAFNMSDSSSSEPDSFFDLLARSQSRRIDDQRCPSHLLDLDRSVAQHCESSSSAKDNKENSRPPIDADEEFLNLVANVQSSQLHNQHARFVGFNADQQSGATSLDPTNGDKCKDELNRVLLQQQSGRVEMQRSQPPTKLLSRRIPDDEDLTTLIQRMQSSRLNEQHYLAAPKKSLPVRPPPEPKASRTKSDSEDKVNKAASHLSKKIRRSRFESKK